MNTTISAITPTVEVEPKQYVLLSKKGMKELRQSIQQLTHDRHDAIRQLREVDKTTGHDDRFERNEKLARLEAIETELVEKCQTLSRAQLIAPARRRLQVAIGSVVDLIDQQGKLFRYTIVDSIEANPSDGRISTASPLGSTLIGKTVHDIVEWTIGSRQNTLKLVRIA